LHHRKCWGKKLKDAATRCSLRPVDALKCVCGWGSFPDPAGGAYSAPSDPLTGFGRENLGRGMERAGDGK